MKSLLLLAATIFASLFISASQTLAYDPYAGIDCSKYTDPKTAPSICKVDSSDPLTGANGTLIKVASIVAYIAGAAAVILIVISSIRFVTSAGDAAKVKKARDTIIYSLVGIVVIVLARTIIVYIVNRV